MARQTRANPTDTGRRSLPAKLTRPAATGLLQRERLFRELDLSVRCKVLWISGPGGAGKTSLVATWLDARDIDCIWYRLDAGDADLANLFHYLRLSGRGRESVEPLPAFAPAHVAELDLHARRFFEAYFAGEYEALTLVFDNFERLPTGSRVDEVLAAMLAVLPAHSRVIVLSRGGAPAALARWEASPDFAAIGWDRLRFSSEESSALAAAWGMRDPGELAPITRSARGWAAGIVLMLRAAQDGVTVKEGAAEPPRGLFNYFASEIFERAPAGTQAFLLKTALLADITPDIAEALTGEPRAHRILAKLHQDHFFIERKAQAETTYELHPLFRDFLRARAMQTLTAAAIDGDRRRAAELLEEAGQVDAAAALWIEAQDWEQLARLICECAQELIGRAKVATLHGWLDQLPHERVERSGWLLLWRGWCLLATKHDGWHESLERARSVFDGARDVTGSFLVRGWLMQSTASSQECGRLALEVLAIVERDWPQLPLREQLDSLTLLRNDPRTPASLPLVRSVSKAAASLLDRVDRTEPRLRVANVIAQSATYSGDLAQLKAVDRDSGHLLGTGEGSVRLRALFLANVSYHSVLCGTRDENQRRCDELAALADACDFSVDQAFVWTSTLFVALAARDFARAGAWERRLRPVAALVPWRYLQYLGLSCHLHLQTGHVPLALDKAQELHALMPIDSPFRGTALCTLGQVVLEQGDVQRALGLLEDGLAASRVWRHPAIMWSALLTLAVAHGRAGHEALALEHLHEALVIGREFGLVRGSPMVADGLLSDAMSLALRRSVEPDYVEAIIRKTGLPAPSPELEQWPWPVRIRTLGMTALEVCGAEPGPRQPTGKRQRQKPLELLHLLITHGSKPVPLAAAIDALWPEAEGDSAKKTFDITLHRLRKVLGADAAVALERGRLSIDAQTCWVDAFSFARLVAHIEAGEAQADDESLDDTMVRALALYRGHFLTDEADHPWAAAYRDKLRAQFMRLVDLTGERWEASGRRADAELCYRKALELDPLAEALYRRLMQSLSGRGETAEALDVYRRCREMLSDVLGRKPSPETVAAYERLLATR